MPGADLEYRILIHAPLGKDARLIAELVRARRHSICGVCAQLGELVEELGRGAGALLVADEAITPEFLRAVGRLIERRPEAGPACRCWS